MRGPLFQLNNYGRLTESKKLAHLKHNMDWATAQRCRASSGRSMSKMLGGSRRAEARDQRVRHERQPLSRRGDQVTVVTQESHGGDARRSRDRRMGFVDYFLDTEI
eukprot:1849316-Pyramimonas_sp.AAC.1